MAWLKTGIAFLYLSERGADVVVPIRTLFKERAGERRIKTPIKGLHIPTLGLYRTFHIIKLEVVPS
jgi:hypothetical protein